MTRTTSAQVANRNAAALKATAALTARRTAHAVVVDLEARAAAADTAWKTASATEAADLGDDNWLDAMLSDDQAESDDLYDVFVVLAADLETARAAHADASVAHDAAEASLSAAKNVIIRDRSARFRQLCRSGARDDYGHE